MEHSEVTKTISLGTLRKESGEGQMSTLKGLLPGSLKEVSSPSGRCFKATLRGTCQQDQVPPGVTDGIFWTEPLKST